MSTSSQREVGILLGSNIGDRANNLFETTYLLEGILGKAKFTSSVYETEPWGVENQGWYLNQLLVFITDIEALELMNKALATEKQMGRVRKTQWEPRVIDIDILFAGTEIHNHLDLILPHPRLHLRKFCLYPIQEILPHWIHPLFNISISDLIAQCQDTTQLKKINSHE